MTSILVRFGRYTFDRERVLLWRDGQTVDANLTALRILQYLIDHSGTYVSHEELSRYIYGSYSGGGPEIWRLLEALRHQLGESLDVRDRNRISIRIETPPRSMQYSPSKVTGPPNADFLFFIFLDQKNCDAFVGDLEDRYKLILNKFGTREANFWYWTQTITSLAPIIWAWAKLHLKKPVAALATIAAAKGLIGHEGWLAVLVELVKRVRS